MKKTIFYLILIAIVAASCNNQPKTDSQKEIEKEAPKELFKTLEGGTVCYTIGDQYAGEFVLGDEIPTAEFLENFDIRKESVSKRAEGEEVIENLYIISKEGADMIQLKPTIEMVNETEIEHIGEILVVSEKFKTGKGICVNSTLEDFIKAYPDYSIWYTYVSDRYVMETSETNGQFLLSANDFMGQIENNSDIITLKKEDFKPGAKIKSIRLF